MKLSYNKFKLFAELLALAIIFALAIFTPMQKLDFSLKIFIMFSVIVSSVWAIELIEMEVTRWKSKTA